MKKLMVLVVVLALAISANAMELKLYVNGAEATGDILANVGDTFSLSIYSTGFAQGQFMNFGVVTQPAVGSLTGGSVAAAITAGLDASDVLPYEDFAVAAGGVFPDGVGIAGVLDTYSTNPNFVGAAGIYVDGITFTFAGDGQVQLWNTIDSTAETTNLLGSVNFVSVPEPITVALLGLGGLFIRRKIA